MFSLLADWMIFFTYQIYRGSEDYSESSQDSSGLSKVRPGGQSFLPDGSSTEESPLENEAYDLDETISDFYLDHIGGLVGDCFLEGLLSLKNMHPEYYTVAVKGNDENNREVLRVLDHLGKLDDE